MITVTKDGAFLSHLPNKYFFIYFYCAQTEIN